MKAKNYIKVASLCSANAAEFFDGYAKVFSIVATCSIFMPWVELCRYANSDACRAASIIAAAQVLLAQNSANFIF
jgi:hypothetical protein